MRDLVWMLYFRNIKFYELLEIEKKRGPPTTPMTPSTPNNPNRKLRFLFILSHSSILLPASAKCPCRRSYFRWQIINYPPTFPKRKWNEKSKTANTQNHFHWRYAYKKGRNRKIKGKEEDYILLVRHRTTLGKSSSLPSSFRHLSFTKQPFIQWDSFALANTAWYCQFISCRLFIPPMPTVVGHWNLFYIGHLKGTLFYPVGLTP